MHISQLRSTAIRGISLSLLMPMVTVSNAQTADKSAQIPAQTPVQIPSKTPVLVELFTAEGCSSCPPADALLGKLERLQPVNGAEIIILSEHVDYWNKDGWRDRFSSPDLTDRQTGYSTRLHVSSGNYTPQMVVDGTEQFVGSDAAHALRTISADAQTPKTNLTVTAPSVDGRRVLASVSAAAPFPFKGDLFAALVDPMDTTDVKAGENGGKHLEHAGVVRTMQRIGSLKDLAAGPRSFSLNAPADAAPGSMRVVVFAQRSDSGPVVGIASVPVTPPATTAAAAPATP